MDDLNRLRAVTEENELLATNLVLARQLIAKGRFAEVAEAFGLAKGWVTIRGHHVFIGDSGSGGSDQGSAVDVKVGDTITFEEKGKLQTGVIHHIGNDDGTGRALRVATKDNENVYVYSNQLRSHTSAGAPSPKPAEAAPTPATSKPTTSSEAAATSTSVGWKPSMTPAEADVWAKDSVVKDTLYHGTSDAAARAIAQNGFRLGVPLTHSPVGAAAYLLDTDQTDNDDYRELVSWLRKQARDKGAEQGG